MVPKKVWGGLQGYRVEESCTTVRCGWLMGLAAERNIFSFFFFFFLSLSSCSLSWSFPTCKCNSVFLCFFKDKEAKGNTNDCLMLVRFYLGLQLQFVCKLDIWNGPPAFACEVSWCSLKFSWVPRNAPPETRSDLVVVLFFSLKTTNQPNLLSTNQTRFCNFPYITVPNYSNFHNNKVVTVYNSMCILFVAIYSFFWDGSYAGLLHLTVLNHPTRWDCKTFLV